MIDVLVVGAGLSGLVCATRLVAAGLSVVVVDARDRVGGRLHTAHVGGVTVDLGGQWLSVGQPRLVALAAELGVATFPHRRDGRHVIGAPWPRSWFGQLGAAFVHWRAVRTVRRAMRDLVARDAVRESLRNAVRGSRRDTGSDAASQAHVDEGLDALSLADWLVQTIASPTARAMLTLHAELVLAVDAADVSAACYLRRLAVTGDFAPRGAPLPGGREHRFVGGAQELAIRLAAKLGDRIRLGVAVCAIEPHVGGDLAIRRSDDDDVLVARHVVIAIPPAAARPIAVDLSSDARAVVGATRMGAVVKCFAAYDRAVWRDAGLSGEVYLPSGDVRAIVPIEDEGGVALLAFVVGRAAVAWPERDAAERRAVVLEAIAAHLGVRDEPIAYRESDRWDCVTSVPPGEDVDERAWRGVHGRVYVAGTESAVAWPGYMEGAIEAGERVAAEILAARVDGRER